MNKNDFYEAYDDLLSYTDSINVVFMFIDKQELQSLVPGALGAFSPEDNAIFMPHIPSKISENEMDKMLYIIAHELGHATEWNSLTKQQKEIFNNLYGYWNSCKEDCSGIHIEAFKCLVEREEIAFNIGENILYDLDIVISKKKMYDMRRKSISLFKRLVRITCGGIQR